MDFSIKERTLRGQNGQRSLHIDPQIVLLLVLLSILVDRVLLLRILHDDSLRVVRDDHWILDVVLSRRQVLLLFFQVFLNGGLLCCIILCRRLVTDKLL